VDDVERQYVLSRPVDDVPLYELFGDVVFVVDEEGVELGSHGLWLFVEGDGLSDVFGGEDVCFSHCHAADHHLVVVLILFGQLVQL
jgi:hypothetical protein